MSKVISIFNQKGGVGKTTTVVNLAAALEKLKKKVLVIDMDPQGNASSGLGFEKNLDKMSYDLIVEGYSPDLILERSKNFHLIPSGSDLAGLEVDLAKTSDWQVRLKEAIKDLRDLYDYVLIDSPPSLGILSLMALIASDSIIIPVQCEYYALEGVNQLFETILMVKNNFNPDLDIEGVVLCMYDRRNNLSNQVVEEVKKYFKDKVFKSKIPRNVRLAEAPSFGQTIFEYEKLSRGAMAYKNLAKELVKKG
ncbi:MAG: ParA family protein [Tissierellia bacterium]|nr:ParA family protein [Tissierellia bacterium]